MTTRTTLSGLAAGALAILLAAPTVVAAPAAGSVPSDRESARSSRRALDSDLPTDRPIVATVIEIDGTAGTVMLSTEHGDVALSVTPELAERLSVGDVVVVRFTADEDFPSASPREEPATEPRERI